tara:strand:+ start:3154 stop:3873 length:720 start_codon:yes stop_codon:yes gene_type:complete
MAPKLLISGGSGRFAVEIRAQNEIYDIYAPHKNDMDITDLDSIKRAIDYFEPDIFLHAAALTRPMVKHVHSPDVSIKTNIIGTSNVCLACMNTDIKLVYLSTDYVYPGVQGNYKETDPVLPVNLYAWSKLGGECAIHMCPNALILRICMIERPFVHTKALVDSQKNLMYADDAAAICLKLFHKTGIINVGGTPTTVYDFVKKDHPNIDKIYRKDIQDVHMAVNSTMNLIKLQEVLNNEN